MLARKYKPDYIYITDSDDWLNVNIVDFLHNAPSREVYYACKGCFVNYLAKAYKTQYGLIRYCGSGFAYRYDFLLYILQIDDAVNENSSQQELVASISKESLYDILGNHSIQYHKFKQTGVNPRPFPFRSICWVGGTGDNLLVILAVAAAWPLTPSFGPNLVYLK